MGLLMKDAVLGQRPGPGPGPDPDERPAGSGRPPESLRSGTFSWLTRPALASGRRPKVLRR